MCNMPFFVEHCYAGKNLPIRVIDCYNSIMKHFNIVGHAHIHLIVAPKVVLVASFAMSQEYIGS